MMSFTEMLLHIMKDIFHEFPDHQLLTNISRAAEKLFPFFSQFLLYFFHDCSLLLKLFFPPRHVIADYWTMY
jgi:hypothetical protein